jgi:phage-related protein
MVMIFDRIVKTVVDPIKNAIQAFKNIVQLFDKGIEYIVNKIIELVKNFPLILEDIINNVIKAVLKVIDYGGVPWIDQIKKIIIKARYFVEDVKEDITEFYNVSGLSKLI